MTGWVARSGAARPWSFVSAKTIVPQLQPAPHEALKCSVPTREAPGRGRASPAFQQYLE